MDLLYLYSFSTIWTRMHWHTYYVTNVCKIVFYTIIYITTEADMYLYTQCSFLYYNIVSSYVYNVSIYHIFSGYIVKCDP